MADDKEALMAALEARAKSRTADAPAEEPRDKTDALKLYRHFIDDLNRSTERDMQLAELRC